MVRDPPCAGGHVRNRGIGRARMFVGGFLLVAAVMTWGTAFLMSPHGEAAGAGAEHVRQTVVIYVRGTAIGTLLLTAASAWLLFPSRLPPSKTRDRLLLAIIALLTVGSVLQLVWLLRL